MVPLYLFLWKKVRMYCVASCVLYLSYYAKFLSCVLKYLLGFCWIFRMVAIAFHQTVGTLHSQGYLNNSGFHHEFGNASVKLIPRGSKVNVGLLKRGSGNSGKRSFAVIQASTAHTSVSGPVSSPSSNSTNGSPKKSSKLVFLISFWCWNSELWWVHADCLVWILFSKKWRKEKSEILNPTFSFSHVISEIKWKFENSRGQMNLLGLNGSEWRFCLSHVLKIQCFNSFYFLSFTTKQA